RPQEPRRRDAVLRRYERGGNRGGAARLHRHGQARLAACQALVAARARGRPSLTDPARRQRIEDVCDAALDRDAVERAAFVAAACGHDLALRQDVEALLAHAQTAEGFLAGPMGAVAAQVLGASTDLPPGTAAFDH